MSANSLRHSFATHLLESEIDLRYIEEILVYKCSKITEIYTLLDLPPLKLYHLLS